MTSVLPHKPLLGADAAVPPVEVCGGGQSCFGGGVTPGSAALAGPKDVPGTPALQGHGLLPGWQVLPVVQVPGAPALRQHRGRPLRRRRRRVSQGRRRRWQRLVLFPHHAGRRLKGTWKLQKKREVTQRHERRSWPSAALSFLRYFLGTTAVLARRLNAGLAGVLQTTWPFFRKHSPISDVASVTQARSGKQKRQLTQADLSDP